MVGDGAWSETSDYVFACLPDDPRANAVSECPYEEGEELTVQWDASFIFLSYAYALMGSYLAVMCIRRLFHVRDFKWFCALSLIAGYHLVETQLSTELHGGDEFDGELERNNVELEGRLIEMERRRKQVFHSRDRRAPIEIHLYGPHTVLLLLFLSLS